MTNNDDPGRPAVDKERVAEFLQITFSAMDQALTIYDEELRLVAWNQQYEKLGVVPAEYIHYGASLPEAYIFLAQNGAFGPGDPEALAEFHLAGLRDGPLIENELMFMPDNRKVRIRRFALSNGGVCATLSDVTEEIETQEQLRQSAKMDAIGRLTGGFAHDMNNVLATVMGNIELEQLRKEGTTKFLDATLEAAQRGAELTHHLLAFARKQPLSPEVISPAPLLENLTSMLRPLLGETIAVELNMAPDLGNVEADKTQLESVLVNLAINARDAMPDGGELNLTASSTSIDQEYGLSLGIDAGPYIRISVADTGSGMDQETVSKAFEPFFTTKPLGIGTGLGLSMAYGFINQSNGHIKIDSEPGQGTTIDIFLPIIPASQATDPTAGDFTFEDPDAATKHVLVVEDDPLFRATIVSMLETSGYVVTSVGDGVKAIAALQGAKDYDVLLTDIVLPGGTTGREVANHALTLQPGIVPILMSGYFEDAATQNTELGTDTMVLHKPFRRLDIVREIVKATSTPDSTSPK